MLVQILKKALCVFLLAIPTAAQKIVLSTQTTGDLPVGRVAHGVAGAQCLQTNGATTFWGVCPSTIASSAHKWVNSYDASTGLFTVTQPAAADLSDGTTGSAGAVVLATGATLSPSQLDNIVIADTQSGADMCAKIATAVGLLPSTGGIVDARGFQGAQNCASDGFNTTKPVYFLLGSGLTLTVSTQLNYTAPTSVTVASPSAPTTNATTTTGGTLSNQVFVMITYVIGSTRIAGNLGETAMSAELNVSMNAACAGTPTCTATINIPSGILGATGVNVYESNATGTASKKLCNTFGPLDLGGTYQITANCAGASGPTSTTAYLGSSGIIGSGPAATLLYFNASGFMTCGACSPLPFNWTWKNFAITQTTGGTGQGKLVAFGGDNLTIDSVEFSGGKDGVYWDGVHNSRILNTRFSEIHDGGSYIFVLNSFSACDHILIDNTVIRGGTAASGGGYTAGININGCDDVQIQHTQMEGIDFSRAGSAGAIGLSGVHHGEVVGGTISNMINGDGVDILGNSQTGGASRWSEDINISGITCAGNTTAGGIGSFHGTADCIGIQEARNVTVSGVVGSAVGLNAGTPANRLPCVEVYLSDSVLLQGIICHDSAQGVSTNSSTNLELTSFKATNNQRSGLFANRSVSTCTVSAASPNVAWATGQAFGPWPQGTTIVINGTNFLVSSVTDFHNLVLTANAGITGTFACGVDTFMKIANSEFDSNGRSGEAGDNNKAGVYLDNGSFAQISNSSADDNNTSKTQLWGFETALGSSARFVLDNVTGIGGTGGLILDNVGNAPVLRDNGSDGILEMTTVKAVTSDFVTAGNTNLQTITGLTFTLPALDARRYAIDCHLIYAQQTAGVANSGFGFQVATVAPTNAWATGLQQTAGTTFTGGNVATLTTTTATTIVTSTPTVTTNWLADLHVMVNNPSNASANTVNIMVKTGTAADTMTVRKDSWCSMAGIK